MRHRGGEYREEDLARGRERGGEDGWRRQAGPGEGPGVQAEPPGRFLRHQILSSGEVWQNTLLFSGNFFISVVLKSTTFLH